MLDADQERKRTEQSFFVPKDEIVTNDYDFSINKYKKTEYVPVEYPPTSEIMAKIRELEFEIGKELIENNRLEAVISMPSGVFRPYAGVSTAILIFTKTGHGGTDKVWFYDMKADGYSLDDKRSETKENDIPDIIARFHALDAEQERKRTEQSFFVPKDEIVGNDYDLSINKYKQTEYVAVEYPPTSEIMAKLDELEMEIGTEMDALRELLGM